MLHKKLPLLLLTVCILASAFGEDPVPEVKDLGAGLGERYAASAVFLPKSRQVLCFGGEQNPALTFLDDVMLLPVDAKKPEWKKLECKGPSARAYASMAVDPATDKVYLFGGFQNDMLGDLWTLEPSKRQWSQLKTKGGPGPRDAASLVFVPDAKKGDRLFLIGGLESFSPLKSTSEVWILDLKTMAWSRGPDFPYPAFLMGAALRSKPDIHQIWVCGGQGNQGVVEVLDLGAAKPEWKVDKKTHVPLLSAHVMIYDAGRDALFLHGGAEHPQGDSGTLVVIPCAKPVAGPAGEIEKRAYHAGSWDPKTGTLYLMGGVLGGFLGRNCPDSTLALRPKP